MLICQNIKFSHTAEDAPILMINSISNWFEYMSVKVITNRKMWNIRHI